MLEWNWIMKNVHDYIVSAIIEVESVLNHGLDIDEPER